MSTSETKKVAKKVVVKKPSQHPGVSSMVNAAIKNLKEKKGSSLAAIKKYILANYKGIDMVRVAPFIRRYLKKAVADGVLTQNKGSFRTGAKASDAKPKKPAAKKVKKAKTPKKVAAKKPAAKKAAAKKSAKKPAAKKPAAKKASKAAKKPATKKPAKKATKKPAAKKPAAKK